MFDAPLFSGSDQIMSYDSARTADDLFHPLDPCEDFLSPSDWKQIARALRLTARQQEVVTLIFGDHSRKGIASKLGCTRDGARAHIDQIFEKLAVKSRLQVVLRVVRVHLMVKKKA